MPAKCALKIEVLEKGNNFAAVRAVSCIQTMCGLLVLTQFRVQTLVCLAKPQPKG
jgi:hypothetical protein